MRRTRPFVDWRLRKIAHLTPIFLWFRLIICDFVLAQSVNMLFASLKRVKKSKRQHFVKNENSFKLARFTITDSIKIPQNQWQTVSDLYSPLVDPLFPDMARRKATSTSLLSTTTWKMLMLLWGVSCIHFSVILDAYLHCSYLYPVDRPTHLFYIWIIICCKYTNLKTQQGNLLGSRVPLRYFEEKTSQELRMLSTVTLDCQATKIVTNLGSQL